MKQENGKAKVSVCVVTYNQKDFISQCLESIINQETDFNFEVIVGDDCSSDGTRIIIENFAIKYPNLIKPIFNEKNIGVCNNIIQVYGKAGGEYIAHMDGDDFMLPGKLRIQADRLDQNPDCAMCVHAVRRFDQNRQIYREPKLNNYPKKSDILFLLMNLPFFAHSSKMFRAGCHKGLKLPTGDFLDCYLHIHHALKGKILYLNDALGVYRLGTGISAFINENSCNHFILRNKMTQLAIDAIEYAGRNGIDQDIINKSKAMIYLRNSYHYLMRKDFERFNAILNLSIKTAKVNYIQSIFKCLSKTPHFFYLLGRLRELLDV